MGIDTRFVIAYGIRFDKAETERFAEDLEKLEVAGLAFYDDPMDGETMIVGRVIDSTGSMRFEPPDMSAEIDPRKIEVEWSTLVSSSYSFGISYEMRSKLSEQWKLHAYTEYS